VKMSSKPNNGINKQRLKNIDITIAIDMKLRVVVHKYQKHHDLQNQKHRIVLMFDIIFIIFMQVYVQKILKGIKSYQSLMHFPY